MNVRINEEWRKALADVWESDSFAQTAGYVRREYSVCTVFPGASKIFAAFDLCPFSQVKVVIIGQDPYHGDGQANGLAFSVEPNIDVPPSLVNIFKEIHDDVGSPIPDNGDLTRWAKQGVLLLNNSLTVRAHSPASHSNIGWELVTDAAIKALSENRQHLVFILWGSHAQRKLPLIDSSKHLVLTAPHPSPLSAYRGFFGCKHFTKTNDYLKQHNITPILW
ncbi:MAG: uracil-DNA glycosylase [Bacteroides sp.]|nr:uracil-DNA glycosylase [Bacteroides sp.]MCM1378694.1 uracil-DNA glycosylase [Bacteroides sp.]MCM1444967.1 uracil-DNA glycosylase [Prevotella sp.]